MTFNDENTLSNLIEQYGGDDLIARIQKVAAERAERGRPHGRNHVQQFFYEAANCEQTGRGER